MSADTNIPVTRTPAFERRASHIYNAGVIFFNHQQLEGALNQFELSAGILEKNGRKKLSPGATSILAYSYQYMGDCARLLSSWDKALESYQRAIALYITLGFPDHEIDILHQSHRYCFEQKAFRSTTGIRGKADDLQQRGDYNYAIDVYLFAIGELEITGTNSYSGAQKIYLAVMYQNLGHCQLKIKADREKIEKNITRAISIYESVGLPPSDIRILSCRQMLDKLPEPQPSVPPPAVSENRSYAPLTSLLAAVDLDQLSPPPAEPKWVWRAPGNNVSRPAGGSVSSLLG